jgi:EAL domain-containing protein (putative c-di-GMP-specific phosphodiesterase class I)
MRHPQWGIVQPAYFMSTAHDWCSRELSQFVVHRALADWRYFVSEQRRLDLSINLLISFLEDPASIDCLRRQLPDHPAFDGLIIEIDGGDMTRDLSVARKFANDVRLQCVTFHSSK